MINHTRLIWTKNKILQVCFQPLNEQLSIFITSYSYTHEMRMQNCRCNCLSCLRDDLFFYRSLTLRQEVLSYFYNSIQIQNDLVPKTYIDNKKERCHRKCRCCQSYDKDFHFFLSAKSRAVIVVIQLLPAT